MANSVQKNCIIERQNGSIIIGHQEGNIEDQAERSGCCEGKDGKWGEIGGITKAQRERSGKCVQIGEFIGGEKRFRDQVE